MDLTGKLGPIPIWGWAVGIVGVYVLFHYLHGATSSTPATVSSATLPTNYSLPGAGATQTSGSATSSSSTPSTPTTNAEWGNAAAAYLIGAGDNPSLVEQALSDFLAGNTLTASEQTLVNAALKQLGSPPGGVLPTGATGTTTTTTPTAPVASPGGGGGTILGSTPTGSSTPGNFQPPPPPAKGQPWKPVYGPTELYTIQRSDMRSSTAATWAYLQNKLLPGLGAGKLQAANAGVTPLPGVVIHYQKEYKVAA